MPPGPWRRVQQQSSGKVLGNRPLGINAKFYRPGVILRRWRLSSSSSGGSRGWGWRGGLWAPEGTEYEIQDVRYKVQDGEYRTIIKSYKAGGGWDNICSEDDEDLITIIARPTTMQAMPPFQAWGSTVSWNRACSAGGTCFNRAGGKVWI